MSRTSRQASVVVDADGPYLLMDPALSVALADNFPEGERAAAEARWLEAVETFVGYLYGQTCNDARVAHQGTRTALADLLAVLARMVEQVEAGTRDAAQAMDFVTNLEELGLPRVLRRISKTRQSIAERLKVWSHARFIADKQEVAHKLDAGDVKDALNAAHALRQQAEAAGDVYPEAAYDRAQAALMLGQALTANGAAEEALGVLHEAEERFAALPAEHGARRTELPLIAAQGDALQALAG